MVSIYIWADLRLKELSIESKNTKKALRTKKLWESEVRGHNQKIRCAEPEGAYCFLSFLDIIYIWRDYILKGITMESKNSHYRILTKELCKLQAMKKISNLQHLQQ